MSCARQKSPTQTYPLINSCWRRLSTQQNFQKTDGRLRTEYHRCHFTVTQKMRQNWNLDFFMFIISLEWRSVICAKLYYVEYWWGSRQYCKWQGWHFISLAEIVAHIEEKSSFKISGHVHGRIAEFLITVWTSCFLHARRISLTQRRARARTDAHKITHTLAWIRANHC